MERGDISNDVVPRLVIAFEGMLGIPKPVPQERRFVGIRQLSRQFGKRKALTDELMDGFEINETLAKVIWDTVYRYAYRIDVVTYLGEEFAEALEKRLDDEHLPISSVWADEPHKLARAIAYRPDIAAIFDNDHHLFYGSKGRILPAGATSLIGAL